MFVRWQVRKYKRGGDAWYASLCEGKRIEGKSISRCLGYLGSFPAASIKNRQQREIFWQQVRVNLETHNLTQEQREQIEWRIAQRVPYPKDKRSIQHSTGEVEWYTPPEWVNLARAVMGGIDLDPASNELAQGWIQATTYYTVTDDGLSKPWHGRMWMNPPYIKGSNELWVNKAIAEYEAGNLSQAVVLVNSSDGTKWYTPLIKRFYKATPSGRINFINKDGMQKTGAAVGNALFYIGDNTQRFKKIFEDAACIVTRPA